MSKPNRGPRALSDSLGELFVVRGYGQLRARQELENAWNAAVGEATRCQTQLGEVRRGVLSVTVAHSTLLEELAAFHKPELLAALRSHAPATPIHDIRFRVGAVGVTCKCPVLEVSPSPGDLRPTHHRAVHEARAQVENRSKPGRGSGHNAAQP
jgi:predicted nucleic acid-binding Zn ribbon protein